MPRKKSAAKKAKELAEKAKLQGKPVEQLPIVAKEDNRAAEQEETTSVLEDDNSSSSSEEEDDYGELITEEVDEGIKNVIQALRTEATDKLLDHNVKFFEDPEEAVAKLKKSEKHKPIYLKDYHRMNLLSGNQGDEEMELGTVDGKQSFASQQREEKAQLLSEINNAISEVGKDDSDDEFLTKKEKPAAIEEKIVLPDPSVDDEKFLQEFLDKQAWIPKKGDKMVDSKQYGGLQEDDDEFDDAVEQFETAYNFRYEDPNAAEIVSYARTQATLRRSETNSRRRKRELEKAEKQKEKEEKEKAIHKKKTKTVNQIADALERIKKEYGAEINEEMAAKLTETVLKDDFDDKKWDDVVGELFDEEFYSHKDKPTWDEDDEIMGDFYKQKEAEQAESSDEEIDANEPPNKKSKKEKKKEKREKKGEKKKILELVEDAVEKNKIALIEKAEEERGRSKNVDSELKFRYREVSPESFGLTTREILAADDADLNEFIGLKKFAPYRPKELRNKDKRKVTKSRRLREWRKKVFNNEEGLKDADS